MRPEQQRVKQLLTEAISSLCRNSLQFKEDVQVEGLLGITLDKRDIFLVSINETVDSVFKEASRKAEDDAKKSETNSKRQAGKRKIERQSVLNPRPVLESGSDVDQVRRVAQALWLKSVTKLMKMPIMYLYSVLNIEKEQNEENGNSLTDTEDVRKFNAAHDETATSNQSQLCDNKPFMQNVPANDSMNDSRADDTVKQEPDDEVYMIHDDSDGGSDVSTYSQGDDSMNAGFNVQGWAQPDAGDGQAGFQLSELDMSSAANFQEQVRTVRATTV